MPLSLTGCANATLYSISTSINGDGQGHSPYSDVLQFEDKIADLQNFTDLKPNIVVDSSNRSDFTTYLPSHYVYDSTNYAAYAYCQPDKIQDNIPTPSNYDWNLPMLSFLNSDGDEIVSYRNQNLMSAINSNANISTILKSYYSYILNFLAQPAIATNPNTINRTAWLNALVNPYNIEGQGLNIDELLDFYNFIFSNYNSLSESGTPIQFGADANNFKYASSIFGPGPLLSKDEIKFESDEIEDTSIYANAAAMLMSNRQLLYALSQPYYATSGNVLKIGDTTIVGGTPSAGEISIGQNQKFSSPYVNYYYDNDTGEINGVNFKQVPVLIKGGETNYSYWNFKEKHNTINGNDWLLNKDLVNKSISKSSSWKNYGNFTDGAKPEITGNNVTFTPAISSQPSATFPRSVTLEPGAESLSTDYAFYKLNPDSGTFLSNDYIGFANYGCYIEKQLISEEDQTYATILSPYCMGITSVYPINLFFNIDVVGNMEFDDSLLEVVDNSSRWPSIDGNAYGNIWEKYYSVSAKKLDEKFNKSFAKFYQTFLNANTMPFSNLSGQALIDREYSLLFASSLLGIGSIKTSDFIHWN